MKSGKLRLYIIEITLIIFLLLAMIFNKTITRQIISVILLVYMIITVKFIKTDKMQTISSKKLTLLFVAFGAIYVSSLYLLGIFFGFYSSTVKLTLWSIINYIVPYIVIIISSEYIRKTILLKESKVSKILITIALAILDTLLYTNIFNLSTIKDYFTVIVFVIFSSIANNVLYNYIIVKHRNVQAIILYRIITTLYIYIIPITPDIHIFFDTVIRLVVPYVIFLVIELAFEKKTIKILSTKQKIIQTIITLILVAIVTIVIMLVSCKFKYGLVVIGSGSMTGTINKGDIILFEKYDNRGEIKTGEVVIFKSEELQIVHRVIDQRVFGEETRYYTKGDANLQEDDGYREKKDIIGLVKGKIPFIGYLTLWINDMVK